MGEDKMPTLVAEVFDPLKVIVITAHFRWKLCVQLYGTKERVELLYRFADVLFQEIKTTLIADVLLKLCNLTDPPVMGKNENLTLLRLRDVIEGDQAELPSKLNLIKLLDTLHKTTERPRAMRNRLIAHRDWGRRAEPLPVTTQQEIDDTLGLIAKIMNAVESHYRNAQTNYQPYPVFGDGDGLIRHLTDLARRMDSEPKPWETT